MARRSTRPARTSQPRQLGLHLPTWGGPRKGAGRKPKGERAGVPHQPRPVLLPRFPLHVTLRVCESVWNLRSRRSYRVLEQALLAASHRFGLRIVEFSIQGNHLHLLAEASDRAALMRGLKGLSVRIARGMNRLMGRHGQVLADRYHVRPLKTPSETRRAIHYVRENYRKHRVAAGERLPAGFRDPYASTFLPIAAQLPAAQTWLLRVGWQRGTGP